MKTRGISTGTQHVHNLIVCCLSMWCCMDLTILKSTADPACGSHNCLRSHTNVVCCKIREYVLCVVCNIKSMYGLFAVLYVNSVLLFELLVEHMFVLWILNVWSSIYVFVWCYLSTHIWLWCVHACRVVYQCVHIKHSMHCSVWRDENARETDTTVALSCLKPLMSAHIKISC